MVVLTLFILTEITQKTLRKLYFSKRKFLQNAVFSDAVTRERSDELISRFLHSNYNYSKWVFTDPSKLVTISPFMSRLS